MKRILIFIVCMIVWLPLTFVAAQGGTTTLPDGTVLDLPSGWTFEDQNGIYHFAGGVGTYLDVYPPDLIATLAANLPPDPTPGELLIHMYTHVMGYDINVANITTRPDGALYPFDDNNGTGQAAVITWDDNTLLFFEVYAPHDAFDAALDKATLILGQMKAQPSLPPTGGACYVRTDQPGGVPLRVGPGVHRGEFVTLMPADGELLVLGQATVGDGSLWYRVEEDYTAANELWVAAADVIAAGACDAVGVAAIPPIIAPPPPPPVTGGATGQGGPPPTGTLLPAVGTWHVTYSPILVANCGGFEHIEVYTGMEALNSNVRLVLSPDGSVITLEGPVSTWVFIRQTPGLYATQGTPVIDPNMRSVYRLHVTSPTTMWGEIVVELLDMDCSGSTTVAFEFIG